MKGMGMLVGKVELDPKTPKRDQSGRGSDFI